MMQACDTAVISVSKDTRVVIRRELSNPLALDLFAQDFKDQWLSGFVEAAKKFNTFYPSDVRAIYQIAPASDKWHGAAFHRLLGAGARKTGLYRSSLKNSRKGSVEWEWTWTPKSSH